MGRADLEFGVCSAPEPKRADCFQKVAPTYSAHCEIEIHLVFNLSEDQIELRTDSPDRIKELTPCYVAADRCYKNLKQRQNSGEPASVTKVREILQRFIGSYRPVRTEPVIQRLRHGGYAAQEKSEAQ